MAALAPSRGLARARRAVPWLLALALLAVLLWRVSPADLAVSLRRGPALWLALYVAAVSPAVLVADGWATWAALRACGLDRPFAEVTWARGATYLLGLVNYAAGQGGMGFYVHRWEASLPRTAGIVLFLLLANGLALVVVATLGLGETVHVRLPWLLAAAAGIAACFGLIASRPGWLRRRAALAPSFDAGVAGWARAIGSRAVHVLVLVAALWGGLRMWGVPVPPGEALRRLPVVLLAAALPVTPGGLGTTQAAFVLLFADRSAAPTAAEREADVLAFALAWSALAYVAQAAIGWWCYRRLVILMPPAAADPGGRAPPR